MSPIEGLKRIARERSRASVREYWQKNKGFIAWVVMAVAVAAASIQSYLAASEAQDGVNQINKERTARINTQSSINAFFCEANNQQNAVLGKLIAISLRGAPPAKTLTHEQLHELRIFREVGQQLSEPTNCRQLALELAKATGIDPSEIKITPLLGIAVGNTGKHPKSIGRHQRHSAKSTAGAVEGDTRPAGRGEETEPAPAAPTHSSGGVGTTHSGGAAPVPPQTHGTHGGGHQGHHGGHGGHGGHDSSPGGSSPGTGPPPSTPAPTSPAGGEEEGSQGDSSRLKVCALQPLLKKCVEAELEL